MKSNDYKKAIFNMDATAISGRLKELILDKLLYKYIWVVEFGSNKKLRGITDPNNRLIFGEFVIDATSNVHKPGLFFLHFPGLLVISDPSNNEQDRLQFERLEFDKMYPQKAN